MNKVRYGMVWMGLPDGDEILPALPQSVDGGNGGGGGGGVDDDDDDGEMRR